MSLTAGTNLGPYEILALIGAGGMGEVYKARDTRLDRTVAIKVSHMHPNFNGSVTILVVDDETLVRDFCTVVLRSAGYNVLSAEDGYRALEMSKALKGPVHLALIDIQMPRMSGPELLLELLDCLVPRNLDIRFILMSGFSNLQPMLETKGHHYSFLQKPFTLAGLLEKVEEELR